MWAHPCDAHEPLGPELNGCTVALIWPALWRSGSGSLPTPPHLMAGEVLLRGQRACTTENWPTYQAGAMKLLAALPRNRTTSELELLEAALDLLQQHGAQAAAQPPAALQLLRTRVYATCLPGDLADHRKVVNKLVPMVAELRGTGTGNSLDHERQEVYELRCDMVSAAGRGSAPELLKALHGLVSDIYPRMRAQAGLGPGTGAVAGCERAGEVHAAHLLFLAVAPNKPPPGERVEVLRGLAHKGGYLDHPAVKWAIKVVKALAINDWVGVWALREHLPCTCCGAPVGEAHRTAYSVASRARAGSMAGDKAAGGAGGSGAAHNQAAGSTRASGRAAGSREVTDEAAGSGSSGSAAGSGVAESTWAGVHQPAFCPMDSCAPSRLLMEVLDMQLDKLRLQALAACASSYRSLPWSVAVNLLGLRERGVGVAGGGADEAGDGGPSGVMAQPLAFESPGVSESGSAAGSGSDDWAGWENALKDVGSGAHGGDSFALDAEAARVDAAALLALCGLLHQGAVRGIRGSVVAWDTLQAKVVAGAGMPELGNLVFKV